MNIHVIESLLKGPPAEVFNLLNSSSSNDSETEHELESDEEISVRNKRRRIENFVENVVENYSDREYKKHFRLTRNTTTILENLISPQYETIQHGREKISAHDSILILLWYMANQETFRTISDRFNVTESSAYRVINKVVDILFEKRNDFIKWPEPEEYKKNSDEFKKKKGLKGVIGAIDGSHIPIKRPQHDSHDYVNRKGWHSIILQGTVDYKKMFIDVSCGEPGSLHDARVLRKSSLYRRASSGENLFQTFFLLGDSAYPSLPWLVPPYRDNGHLSQNQIRFNYLHSSTRIIVENAFGLLKGRFRRLNKFDNNNINFIVKSTIVACMLHNICIAHDDLVDEEDINDMNGETDSSGDEVEDRNNTREYLFNTLF